MEATGAALVGHSDSSSSAGLRVKLVARVLIVTFTLASIDTSTSMAAKIVKLGHENNVISFRYMFSCALLGLVYSFLQIAVSIYSLSGASGLGNQLAPLDFYGDLVILYALATGAVAGFRATLDPKIMVEAEGMVVYRVLFDKSDAAAAIFLFLGSVFSAISLVCSAFDLRKRYHTNFRRYTLNLNNFC